MFTDVSEVFAASIRAMILHDATTQKTAIFILAIVRTSNLNLVRHLYAPTLKCYRITYKFSNHLVKFAATTCPLKLLRQESNHIEVNRFAMYRKWLDDQGSIPDGQRIFLLDWLQGPPSLLSNGYRVKRGRGMTLTTHPRLVPRLMSRSKTYLPPRCIHCV
jgi:hypothetical protein